MIAKNIVARLNDSILSPDKFKVLVKHCAVVLHVKPLGRPYLLQHLREFTDIERIGRDTDKHGRNLLLGARSQIVVKKFHEYCLRVSA